MFTQGPEEFRVNKWITYLKSHLKKLAQWDLYESTVNDSFASYLTQMDFGKSITASHILAGARQVTRGVTEGRRPKGDRGAK